MTTELCFHGKENCTELFCKDQKAAKAGPKYVPPVIEDYYSYIPSLKMVHGTSDPETIALLVTNYDINLKSDETTQRYDRYSCWYANGEFKQFLMVNGEVRETNRVANNWMGIVCLLQSAIEMAEDK